MFEFALLHGKWGYLSGTHEVHLSRNSPNELGISFFGYLHCIQSKRGVLEPKDKGVILDVVIQFSWKNKTGLNENAMDNMMHLCSVPELPKSWLSDQSPLSKNGTTSGGH